MSEPLIESNCRELIAGSRFDVAELGYVNFIEIDIEVALLEIWGRPEDDGRPCTVILIWRENSGWEFWGYANSIEAQSAWDLFLDGMPSIRPAIAMAISHTVGKPTQRPWFFATSGQEIDGDFVTGGAV